MKSKTLYSSHLLCIYTIIHSLFPVLSKLLTTCDCVFPAQTLTASTRTVTASSERTSETSPLWMKNSRSSSSIQSMWPYIIYSSHRKWEGWPCSEVNCPPPAVVFPSTVWRGPRIGAYLCVWLQWVTADYGASMASLRLHALRNGCLLLADPPPKMSSESWVLKTLTQNNTSHVIVLRKQTGGVKKDTPA